jgi:hypothetical protein
MAGFFVKALVATLAMVILFVGWYTFTLAGNASNNQVVQIMGNACFPGGICAAQFASQVMGLFEIAMGLGFFMLFLYLALATNTEEPTSFEFDTYG